jgi:phosphate transport system permease protein
MNANPISGPQESLPLFVFRNIRKPDLSAIARGFAGALVLMLIVLALFAIARFIGRDRTRRSARRAARRVPVPASPMPDLVVRGEVPS